MSFDSKNFIANLQLEKKSRVSTRVDYETHFNL